VYLSELLLHAQDAGTGPKRQLSKHRGSSFAEAAQQAQHGKRGEVHRERGHVSQPKASALRLQSSRPPFASISAGRPSNRPPETSDSLPSASEPVKAAEDVADSELEDSIELQAEHTLEETKGEMQGQSRNAMSGMGRISKGNGAQHLLPSLHGPSFQKQQPAPAAAFQPLTADKSLGVQESQQELAEKLGLIKPQDSFARALGPRQHRQSSDSTSRQGRNISEPASDSQESTRIPAGSSHESQRVSIIVPEDTKMSSAHESSKKRRAVQKTQVLEISGAEARGDVSAAARSQNRSVSWLRAPAGRSRALQVSKDGPKDAMRQSQGLKVLLDDKATAKEAQLLQEETADESHDSTIPSSHTANIRPGEFMSDPSAVSDSGASQLEYTDRTAEAGASQTEQNTKDRAVKTTTMKQKVEEPQTNEDLLDNLVSRLHAAKSSSRWKPWGRLRKSVRHTARSVLRDGMPTVQVLQITVAALIQVFVTVT